VLEANTGDVCVEVKIRKKSSYAPQASNSLGEHSPNEDVEIGTGEGDYLSLFYLGEKQRNDGCKWACGMEIDVHNSTHLKGEVIPKKGQYRTDPQEVERTRSPYEAHGCAVLSASIESSFQEGGSR